MDAVVIALAVLGVASACLNVLHSMRYARATVELEHAHADLLRERERRMLAEGLLQTTLTAQRLHQRNEVATPSQQTSQETQREASEVVRAMPVAASRLRQYVKETAAASGLLLTDQDAEEMAAQMLVESGI